MRKKRTRVRPTHIKAWRRFRGLTQNQLAERAGLSQATIARLERGDIMSTQLVLESLAEALGTDPGSLLMIDPEEQGAIWSIWDKLSPAERQQAVRILTALSSKTGANG